MLAVKFFLYYDKHHTMNKPYEYYYHGNFRYIQNEQQQQEF